MKWVPLRTRYVCTRAYSEGEMAKVHDYARNVKSSRSTQAESEDDYKSLKNRFSYANANKGIHQKRPY